MQDEKEVLQKENKAGYYYTLFTEALELHKDKFDEYVELVAYYELQQDKLRSTSRKPWVYQINTPYATDAVNLRVASLQASDYRGELEPLSPDDVDSVIKLNAAYQEQWNAMNMNNHINDAILLGAIVGEANVHIIFDSESVYGGTNRKNQGKFQAYFLDPSSVHIDPKALNLRDADYICVTERVTKNKIKRIKPSFDFDLAKLGDSPEDRGEIYAGNDYTTNQEDRVYNMITIYEKTKNGIEKTVLLDRTILEETVVIPIKVFPIAQFKWQKRVKSPYGTSLLQMLLPLQKVLNEIESANANANMQYSSPSYVLSEDAGIDPEDLAINAGAPAAVYVVASGVKLSEAVQPLIPNRGIDQGLVTTKQELERSIYKLAGVNDAFEGKLGTVGNTSGGADLAIQRAKVIEQRVLSSIEEFVEDITRIIVEYITQAFAGETMYGRGDKKSDGSFDFKAFEVPEDAPDIEYSFYIELDVKTQYSKEQQKQLIRELFEVERQYDTGDVKVLNILDILRASNFPQRDELIERYKDLVKMDSEAKAQLISEVILTAEQFGIDPQLTNAAIAELIRGDKETPIMQQFLQTVTQTQMQQEQAQQQVVNALTNQTIEKEQLAQEPTGDEEFSAQN
jgi:hypothetical protein